MLKILYSVHVSCLHDNLYYRKVKLLIVNVSNVLEHYWTAFYMYVQSDCWARPTHFDWISMFTNRKLTQRTQAKESNIHTTWRLQYYAHAPQLVQIFGISVMFRSIPWQWNAKLLFKINLLDFDINVFSHFCGSDHVFKPHVLSMQKKIIFTMMI